MVTYAGFTNGGTIKQWRCNSSDIVNDANGNLVTSDKKINHQLKNGYEVYDFESKTAYIWDEENNTLRIQ